MTAPGIAREAMPAREEPVGLDLATWGMALFILSETILFSLLFGAYFYLRSGASAWPPEGESAPGLVAPLINTVLLLSSSGTAIWADRARHRNVPAMRLALGITFALGATFLAIQLNEYRRESLHASESVFASLFYVVTGFHGLHVLVGLLMNAYVLGLSFAGRLRRGTLAVRNYSWYWHFVDVVWIFVLSTIYIYPHFAGG